MVGKRKEVEMLKALCRANGLLFLDHATTARPNP